MSVEVCYICEGFDPFKSRQKLAGDVRRQSKRLPVAEQRVLAERRQRLNARIHHFHQVGDEIMGGIDLSEFEVHGPLDETVLVAELVDDEELQESEDEREPSVCSADLETRQELPEQMALWLPSSLQQADRLTLGLSALAEQEIELRIGQADDCLEKLKSTIGYRSLLYRTSVRSAESSKKKTRAFGEVRAVWIKIRAIVAEYKRATVALRRLNAPKSVLLRFQDITSADVKMGADVVEENRFGQSGYALAWFWRLGLDQDGVLGDDWMTEC